MSALFLDTGRRVLDTSFEFEACWTLEKITETARNHSKIMLYDFCPDFIDVCNIFNFQFRNSNLSSLIFKWLLNYYYVITLLWQNCCYRRCRCSSEQKFLSIGELLFGVFIIVMMWMNVDKWKEEVQIREGGVHNTNNMLIFKPWNITNSKTISTVLWTVYAQNSTKGARLTFRPRISPKTKRTNLPPRRIMMMAWNVSSGHLKFRKMVRKIKEKG